MSKSEAGYHEATAGVQARAEANRKGLDDQIAEDAIMAATTPGRIVRGKVLRHPSRGAVLRKYRIQQLFEDWVQETGVDTTSLRYEELATLIMNLVWWDPHYFDDAIEGRETMDEFVAKLDVINDDPSWTGDLISLTDHMIDCLKFLEQTATHAASGEEAKKKP